MTLTLVIAILFTLAAVAALVRPHPRYRWAMPVIFALGAVINWLRYFDVFR
jgi:hypothetical protein